MRKIKLAAAVVFLAGICAPGYAAAQHNHGGGGHGGGQQSQPRDEAAMCPLRAKLYEPALKNLENGVEITLTAKDIRNIARLRELAASHFGSREELDRNCPARVPGAKTSLEEIDGGIKIIITALAPAAVKTIQAAAVFACKREEPVTKRVFKTYVCPMGEYQSSKPGKCPKCGMELVEKK